MPHKCHCGALVDAQGLGLHGFVWKKAPGRPARHHALNDLVAQCPGYGLCWHYMHQRDHILFSGSGGYFWNRDDMREHRGMNNINNL